MPVEYYSNPSTTRFRIEFEVGEAIFITVLMLQSIHAREDQVYCVPSEVGSNGCYMVVFQYGSIVLFNVAEHEVDGYLKIVKKHASGLLPDMRKDEYEVREKPSLSTWMQGGLDYIMLQYLNIDGIRTIGSVLGQSIALDYYGRQDFLIPYSGDIPLKVDGMVAEFTDINREMEATGKFKMQRKKLFQLVGKANSNLADVILKLGLFER
ncbi:hypothetical protein V8G54_030706 [Vigna mungo]|uniref:DUF155 domain-containing protein n=1 Tax=Vigna mungo TaxID=3915 RepID=A0AAQ3MWP1_VIGMU